MLNFDRVENKTVDFSFVFYLKDKYSIGIKIGTKITPLGFYTMHEARRYAESLFTASKLKKAKYIVYDNEKRQAVLANPKSAGTPKMLTINGQQMYSGMQPHTRAKIMTEIKKSFVPYVINLPKFHDYPYDVVCHVFDTYENVLANDRDNWDIGNRAYPYLKGMLDLLTTGMIDKTTQAIDPRLLGDDVRCVMAEGYSFTPINKGEQPYLKFVLRPR